MPTDSTKTRDKSPNLLSVEGNDMIRDLIRKRAIIKGRLTKFTNYLNSLENDENVFSNRERTDLKLRIKGAATLFSDFNDIQIKIEERVSDGELDDQLTQREMFEDSYYSTLAQAESMLNVDDGNDNSKSCENSTRIKSVKLPTISMPTFDGSIERWLEFRDTFTSLVHNCKDISVIQKFHYLKSSLKGEAELVIHSIECSSDNYQVAWELLLNRYNNCQLLVHNHVEALFTMKSLPKESSSLIKNLIDTVLKNVRALNIIGEPTDSWDTLLNYIIVSKLDKTTEREWQAHKGTLCSKDTKETYKRIKVDQLIGFLKDKAVMLETLQHSKDKDTQHVDNKKQHTKSHYTSHCNVSSAPNRSSNSQPRGRTCIQCTANHPLYSCQQFIESDLESKLKLVREHDLCTNCLRKGHTLDDCRFGPCRKCNKKHNSLLHEDNASSVAFHTMLKTATDAPSRASVSCIPTPATAMPSTSTETVPARVQVNESHMQTQCNKLVGTQSVLLSTAIVEVADINGTYHKARALLDNGSQSCFMSKSLCQLLKLKSIQSTIEVRGVGDSALHCSQACNVIVKSCVDHTFTTRIHCYILTKITASVPAICNSRAQFCIPDDKQLADPEFLNSKPIDILIGADRFWDLLEDGRMRLPSGPYLQNTKLGWILSGSVNNTRNYTQLHCHLTHSLDTQLRMFWEIEEPLKVRDAQTEEERACEAHYTRTTTRNSEGRFCVRIPLKQSPDVLGDSLTQAKRRFFALEKRLQRAPEYKKMYSNFMHEYQQLGHMTQVDSYESPCYFMPHHGVFREHSTTTKLRVVFDASAPSSSGISLNDLQMVGPPIQGDLIAILLRFRQHKYVACADVEKMYRQCLVDEEQRHLQMIVWRDDPSQPLGIYKLNTITYGTASAPFLSIRCLKQLASESPDPDVKRVINEDFYVDDYITGLDDKIKLLDICNKTQKTLQSGCFPLRKWIFNFTQAEGTLSSSELKPLNLDQHVSSKTLGLGWHNLSDTLYFDTQINIDNKPITKRSMLSNVSQIFDPLGLLSPIIIVAKVILQQLWLVKLDWDDTVPDNIAQTWNRFVISLQALNTIRIPRHVIGSVAMYMELHVFSDASQTAYGACIYIRTVNTDHTVTVRLLFSKTKVAPLKPLSIPRLELCGALLGARLYNNVVNSLRCKFNNVVCWTDSTIVLGWLHMAPNRLKTFVQHRTVEIMDLTREVSWRHVRSEDNPADLASRGVALDELSSTDLWWEGPEFLRSYSFSINDHKTAASFKQGELPEVRSLIVSAAVAQEPSKSSLFPFNRYSQFTRIRHACAFMLRFIHNTRNKLNKRTGQLTVDELNYAEKTLARLSQMESYPSEYKLLYNKGTIKGKCNLAKLNLFIDRDNIIRVGGRLLNSEEFSYNKKHPILISSKHCFTRLLFRYEHIQLLHAAPQALLFNLRESWWPVGGRNLARQVVHDCVICTRIRGKTLTPMMGNLPKERITPSFPFNRCGVDYAGPVFVLNRRGRGAKTTKAYICIFICFATRAIHLELVSDLSSEAYFLTLKRFISRRGKPTEIYSDNGRNFVGLMNDFSNFLRTCSADIVEFATSQTIKFQFIPPYSPHFGGLWEAGVKSCKFHLRRVVGNAHLTFEEFSTVLAQIEAVLNSRPLSPLSPDPHDFSPLTPGHFLVGRPLTAPACDDLCEIPATRLQRFQRLEQLRQHFWTRWAKEYVSELQVRTKWTAKEDELRPDSLVIIKDNNLPPLKWHLGRVLRTIPGKDGISRVADIKTASGIVRRALTKICPLLQNLDEEIATNRNTH